MAKYLVSIFLFFTSFFSYSQEDEISIQNYNESQRLYNESVSWLTQQINLEKVIINCNKAIDLNPNNSDFYFALSNAYSSLSKLDSARDKILIAIELAPGQSDYHLAAAHIYFKQKNFNSAIDFYTLAIKYNETSEIPIDLSSTYYNLGVSRLKLKLHIEAISDFSKCIDLDNEFAGAYHNRGTAKIRIKQNMGACDDFKMAVSLGSKISQKNIDKYCR